MLECQKIQKGWLDQYGAEGFGRLIVAIIRKNVGMKWLRSSLVQNVPPLVTCSNYQGVRDLESVLSAPESALETVNPDRSGARWRNLLNVFNSIGHVRRSPDGGGCSRRRTRTPRGTTPSCWFRIYDAGRIGGVSRPGGDVPTALISAGCGTLTSGRHDLRTTGDRSAIKTFSITTTSRPCW